MTMLMDRRDSPVRPHEGLYAVDGKRVGDFRPGRRKSSTRRSFEDMALHKHGNSFCWTNVLTCSCSFFISSVPTLDNVLVPETLLKVSPQSLPLEGCSPYIGPISNERLAKTENHGDASLLQSLRSLTLSLPLFAPLTRPFHPGTARLLYIHILPH